MMSYIFLFDTVRVPVPGFHLSKNRTENRFLVPVHAVNRVSVHKTTVFSVLVTVLEPSVALQACHRHRELYILVVNNLQQVLNIYLFPSTIIFPPGGHCCVLRLFVFSP